MPAQGVYTQLHKSSALCGTTEAMVMAQFHSRPWPVVLGLGSAHSGQRRQLLGLGAQQTAFGRPVKAWINTCSLGLVYSFYQNLRGCKTRKRIKKLYC